MTQEPAVFDVWERVRALLEEGKLDDAFDEVNRLTEEFPESAEIRTLLGVLRGQAGDVEGGLSALDEAMALDPELLSPRIEKARLLSEEDRFEEVLDVLEDEDDPEALVLLVSALYELGEHEEAKSACAEAVALEELPELRHLEALIHLQLAEPESALMAARRTVELDPELAEGHHAEGLALTQLGRMEEADRAFARAAEIDPESYVRPCRLEPNEFDEVVDEALTELPEEFQVMLENVEVAIEEVPDPTMVREGLEFDLLGVYQGGTIQSADWGFPDRVILFQRNLENVSTDRDTLIEEIRDTVFHEIGHHMGMDENAVREAEKGTEDGEDTDLEWDEEDEDEDEEGEGEEE